MKTKLKLFISVFFFTLLFSSCSPKDPIVEVVTIESDQLDVVVYENLTVELMPLIKTHGSDKQIKFEIVEDTDSIYATVDDKGVVTGVVAGKTIVVASLADKKLSFRLEVRRDLQVFFPTEGEYIKPEFLGDSIIFSIDKEDLKISDDKKTYVPVKIRFDIVGTSVKRDDKGEMLEEFVLECKQENINTIKIHKVNLYPAYDLDNNRLEDVITVNVKENGVFPIKTWIKDYPYSEFYFYIKITGLPEYIDPNYDPNVTWDMRYVGWAGSAFIPGGGAPPKILTGTPFLKLGAAAVEIASYERYLRRRPFRPARSELGKKHVYDTKATGSLFYNVEYYFENDKLTGLRAEFLPMSMGHTVNNPGVIMDIVNLVFGKMNFKIDKERGDNGFYELDGVLLGYYFFHEVLEKNSGDPDIRCVIYINNNDRRIIMLELIE